MDTTEVTERGKGGNKKGTGNKKDKTKNPTDNSPQAEPMLKQMSNVDVMEGRKTTLKCELRAGNPPPKLKWYKDGLEITGKANKLKDTKVKKKKAGKVSELHILKAADVHAGSYTCEATNNLGKTSTVSKLTLLHAASSTTPAVKTSSHVTHCIESKKNYCVNGGECFTLEVTPGEPKLLCRCPNEFTGDRCQNYVMASFYKAEELYQKRVLTITGICIALLVVGIMCVVAYCKTKKQRKKFHDRLRQSLRNERNTMAGMANGAQMANSPIENVQLVNQFVCKTAFPAQHVMEKETETSFSMSQYTSSAQQSTTVTHTSSPGWSSGRSESALTDSHSVLMMSSGENSRHATPSHRGRLNATGGARDLSAYLKDSRDTPDSCRECLYEDRYVSAMTTPITPGPPPSETSAPLSSLATPGPSQVVSPSGEEEHPLLFTSSPWSCEKPYHTPRHSQSKRNSAHYNHGNDAHTPPLSPLRIVEDDGDYETTQEYEGVAPVAVPPATLQDLPRKLTNGGRRAKRTQVNGHAGGHKMESRGDSTERSSSESETEEDRVGEDTPFLTLQNPLDAGVEPLTDSSRTNPALRLSPQDNLQTRLSSIIANQDPIAV